jgi:transcription elongation factor GreA
MEKIPMTKKGFEALENEYQKLKNIERPAVISAIAEAREHGDLSENAEYHSAREKQGFIEGRIKELEDKISRAKVVDPKEIESDSIKFAATVSVEDIDSGEKNRYMIVGEQESDVALGFISYTSPLARALIGKKAGDEIEFKTPGGTKNYEILNVEYI